MIRVKIENTNLPCENTKIDIWYISNLCHGGFHTPLDLIFFAVNFFVNENDFDEFFGTFTIYSKMYKLFIIYLALERNGKLIKS